MKMKMIFLLCGFFLFLFGFYSSGEAVVDRVVALVNGEIITLSEIEKRINFPKEGIVAENRLERGRRMQEIRQQVLEGLIEEKLLDQEVKKNEVKVSGKELDAALDEIRHRNAATQEDFDKALTAEGLTLESYKKEIEKQLLRQRLISWTVKFDLKAGEKELREFYQKQINRYRTDETYRTAQILFAVPKEATPGQVQEIRKKCEKVFERIRKGEDFGEMALQYSEDDSKKEWGDLGYFKKGELLPVFEKEALSLKVGEVSNIFQTEYGFHIVKLLDHKAVEPPPFEEVKDKVTADYYENEAGKAVKQYLGTLKEKSVIEIKL